MTSSLRFRRCSKRLIKRVSRAKTWLAHSRIEFSTSGAGYSCMVGNATDFLHPWQ